MHIIIIRARFEWTFCCRYRFIRFWHDAFSTCLNTVCFRYRSSHSTLFVRSNHFSYSYYWLLTISAITNSVRVHCIWYHSRVRKGQDKEIQMSAISQNERHNDPTIPVDFCPLQPAIPYPRQTMQRAFGSIASRSCKINSVKSSFWLCPVRPNRLTALLWSHSKA